MTAATIYMSLLGDAGLKSVALRSHQGLHQLLSGLERIEGVSVRFEGPAFHEAVVQVPGKAADVLNRMTAQSVLGGYDLGLHFEALQDCLLVNVTETKNEADIERYLSVLAEAVS